MVDKNNVRDKVDRRFKPKKKSAKRSKARERNRKIRVARDRRQKRRFTAAGEVRERKQKNLLAKLRKAHRDKHRIDTIRVLFDILNEQDAAIRLSRYWKIKADDLGWPEVWR